MYLIITQDSQKVFQIDHEPTEHDILSISDGQRIIKFVDGKFWEMTGRGSAIISIPFGRIEKDAGIEWSTIDP